MSKQQNDNETGQAVTTAGVPQIGADFGLRFKGIITAVAPPKDWTEYGNSGNVLGMQTVLSVSDGVKGYTYTLKTEKGQAHPELRMFQQITIINAGLTIDKGLARLSGDYLPE